MIKHCTKSCMGSPKVHQLCGKPPGNQTDLHNSDKSNNSTSCWLIAHQTTNPGCLSDNRTAAHKDLRRGFSKLLFFLARGKTSGANYICQTVLRDSTLKQTLSVSIYTSSYHLEKKHYFIPNNVGNYDKVTIYSVMFQKP